MTQRDKIFVDGMQSFDIPETTPDFILGKGSFSVDTMIAFLNNHKEYEVKDDKGFPKLYYTIKRSKGGKRYIELDLWKYDQEREKSFTPEERAVLEASRERERAAKASQKEAEDNGIPF